MPKKITTAFFLVAIQFTAYAGGPSTFNTTWTPTNLFVQASNGAITTGTITVTSNYAIPNGNPLITTTSAITYSTSTISPLGLNMASFFHSGGVGTNVTSVIGYSIDLTTNTFVGTVLGSVKLQNNSGGNYNGTMPFTIETINANRPLITEWNLSISGSGATQLTFGVGTTTGIVNYQWATIPATVTGTGTFTGTIASITGLPVNARISLSIDGTNFNRFNMNNGSDRRRLTNVAQWGSVAWASMANAFYNCENLQISATDIPNLNTVTTMALMFRGCTRLNSPSNIGSWNTSAVTNMFQMFYTAENFNQPIGTWNTSSVTNMSGMFTFAENFNQPIGNWNTSAVNDMSGMFYFAADFNQPIGNWNTSAVNNMDGMFLNAYAFNQSIGGWNTSLVENMASMFQSATAFNQPIGNWNTSSVQTMNRMFAGASSFNQPIGNWNTSTVTNMANMFLSANVFNQSISGWNISNAFDMSNMFDGASAFNQNLGAWGNKLKSNVDLSGMLNNSGLSSANYDATLEGFSTTTVTNRTFGASGRRYCAAAAARAVLRNSTSIGGKGWTITDAGATSPETNILVQPASSSSCSSANAIFTISATGTSLTYTWSNGLSTTNTMTTSISGNYTATVSGTCGTVVSNAASHSVLPTTQIVTQPAGGTYCEGSIATISVSATGDNLGYLWSFGSTLRENTGATRLIDNGDKYVTVTGTCGQAVSNAATYIINPLTTVVSPIANQTVSSGMTANLAISATGTALAYLWNSGETTPAISNKGAGTYTVTISGVCGVLTASGTIAEISVNTSPSAVVTVTGILSNGNVINSLSAISITLTGTGFVTGAAVSVNGVGLLNINVVNANTIIATLPPGAVTNSPVVGVNVQNAGQVLVNISSVIITNTSVTNIQSFNIQNLTISIYPNPVNEAEFTLTNAVAGESLTIINATGIVVYSQIITSSPLLININLPSGMYILKAGGQALRFMKL
ncbi:MAG: BspA family leucine-rich repeat surface protein [Cytophagales bacterium]|nr:BspA family leucine-rich repeat surface protein [Cytophagales bacterium]